MASFTKLLQENTTTIITSPPPPPPNHTSNSDFTIAIALLAILAVAILLISYYIFVIKCCLNWQNLDPLRRFSSFSRRAQANDETSLISFSPMADTVRHRGLEEFLLNNIPAIQYKTSNTNNNNNALGPESSKSFRGCAVCLCAFEEKEMLRVLPRCKHTFHLDCIDVWLLNNASCPLCRSSISGRTKYPIDHIIAPSSSPQEFISPLCSRNLSMVNFNGDDQDYLVIEIGEEDREVTMSGTNCYLPTLQQQQQSSMVPSKYGSGKTQEKKLTKKLHNLSIMGDECLNMRQKDEQFEVEQPIRRSFSMDSAVDRGLILQVQEIVRQNHRQFSVNDVSSTSNSNELVGNIVANGRVRRSSFFSFGHGRGSRSSSILPIEFECDR